MGHILLKKYFETQPNIMNHIKKQFFQCVSHNFIKILNKNIKKLPFFDFVFNLY